MSSKSFPSCQLYSSGVNVSVSMRVGVVEALRKCRQRRRWQCEGDVAVMAMMRAVKAMAATAEVVKAKVMKAKMVKAR